MPIYASVEKKTVTKSTTDGVNNYYVKLIFEMCFRLDENRKDLISYIMCFRNIYLIFGVFIFN